MGGENANIMDPDTYIKKLQEELKAEKESFECLKQHHRETDAQLRAVSAELQELKTKMEALRAEKASLDILYAGRGGMIEAYEYALDAIAGRNNKC